jgi:hypothetical protein
VAKRRYRIVHESYLAEFLGLNFPPGTWRTNVRLGRVKVPEGASLSPEEERLLKGAFAGSADAIVFLEDEVIIIEAMVRHEPGSVEDLLRYKRLFLSDPEFREHWGKRIRLMLVTPLELGEWAKFAEEQGIEIVRYAPPWIMEYIYSYPRREWRGKGSSTIWE